MCVKSAENVRNNRVEFHFCVVFRWWFLLLILSLNVHALDNRVLFYFAADFISFPYLVDFILCSQIVAFISQPRERKKNNHKFK